ncbi:Helix-turn-helix domain-containing protein [Pseudorhodobacter antarcticus]|uniref:Helix-turn-helix domain-containing protein n=1 Tax=Pseudorhodobacter antarcticus TaxID=1077947 RepID=A0A1H8AQ51_9RHOB|nr:Helix-turn-helix domain-containing protein [Pseudorhodobacter antarcticus]
MARTGRLGLSHEQKIELWQRWKAGETLSDIGRALGKHAASVFGVVVAKGGYAPVPRTRKPGSLSLADREEISRGLVAGRSFRQLGRHLGRAA